MDSRTLKKEQIVENVGKINPKILLPATITAANSTTITTRKEIGNALVDSLILQKEQIAENVAKTDPINLLTITTEEGIGIVLADT